MCKSSMKQLVLLAVVALLLLVSSVSARREETEGQRVGGEDAGRGPRSAVNGTRGNWTELPPFGNFSGNGTFRPPQQGGRGPRAPVNGTDGNWTELPPFGNFSGNGSFRPPQDSNRNARPTEERPRRTEDGEFRPSGNFSGNGTFRPPQQGGRGPRAPVNGTDGNWTELPPFGNFSGNGSFHGPQKANGNARPSMNGPRPTEDGAFRPFGNETRGNWTELPPFGNFSGNGTFRPPQQGGRGPRAPVNGTAEERPHFGNWTQSEESA